MKTLSQTKLLMGAIFAVAMMLVVNLQAATKEVTAKVRAIRGTAQVSLNGTGWAPLKVNDNLKAGAVIKTGADSSVDLFLNNSVVRVTPETTISFDKLLVTETGSETVTETQLNLRSGRIIGNVKKLAAASKYEIKVPTGVVGIRGTDYDITVVPMGNGHFKLTVTSLSGTLVGSAVNMQKVLVTAVINTGETWSPDDGMTVLPPEVIAAAREALRESMETGKSVTVTVPDTVEYSEPNIGVSRTE